jgi:alpha-L-rhamnosidase
MAECAWKLDAGKFDLDLLIPPNTSALVILPGSDTTPIEVGAGVWRWSVLYQIPEERSPYTVDDLVGDILSDHTARDAILDALVRAEAPDFLRAMIFNDRGLPLRQALRMAPNYDAAVKIMSDTLANL